MLPIVALSSVDQIVAVSREVQDLVVRGWGVSARKVQVVHNGVPEISPRLTPAERAALRNELGFSQSDFVVGSVGGFRPVKNFPTLVECIARSREQMPTLKLLLVGDGSGRAAIEESVRHHRLHGIVALPGWRADVPRLLQVMDLFALSSLSEGISLSILEAMMAGLPVVATHVGGNPEIVEHQATGLLVPVDPRAIAEAILSLAGDMDTRTRMGRLARERAETRFTEARMARDYQRVYVAATE